MNKGREGAAVSDYDLMRTHVMVADVCGALDDGDA